MYELILTSSPDGPITTYDASSGAIVAEFTGSRSPCRGLTMAGQELVAASHVSSDTGTGSIHIYKWYTSIILSIPLPESVAPLTATSDGVFLFAGGVSGSVYSLSLPSGDLIKSFTSHSKPVSCLRLNDDESLVISGSDDGTIVVIPTFKLVKVTNSSQGPKDLILHKWKAHSDSITSFNSGIGLCNSTLISCSLDCTCKFWSLSNEIILMRTVTFPCAILGFVVDPSESGFYAGGADGLVYKGLKKRKEYELISWGGINKSESHDGSIVSLVLVNEGRNLVSAGEDGSVWVWDVEEGEIVMKLGWMDKKVGISSYNCCRGRVSDMIVAKLTNGCDHGVKKGNNDGEISGFITSSGLYDEELIRTFMQITELGDFVDVAMKDKRRAIEMLESTIVMYERLLRLILKEATKAMAQEEKEEENVNNYKGKKVV